MDRSIATSLPARAGVYLFKDVMGRVLYIGKASSLKSRVGSYFARAATDWKVKAIMAEAIQVSHVVTESEQEAALLEVRLIREHQPKYNVMAKDGQPFVYLLFTRGQLPRVEVVRNKTRKGDYHGPLLCKQQARRVHRYLLQTFCLNVCNKKIENGCLDYHLGSCPGTCRADFDRDAYLFRLGLAQAVLKEDQEHFVASVRQRLADYSAALEYEKAKQLRDYLDNVDRIFVALRAAMRVKEYVAESVIAAGALPFAEDDAASLAQRLQELVGADTPVRTVDCFDVSHFQGRSIVGSCIRFRDGKPDKNLFRRFRVRSLKDQDDYAALRELAERRYKKQDELPDLILIDGGKGQLSAVRAVLPDARCVALAKKEECLFGTDVNGARLDVSSEPGRSLIALRDYAHHFAIQYHRLLRNKPAGW